MLVLVRGAVEFSLREYLLLLTVMSLCSLLDLIDTWGGGLTRVTHVARHVQQPQHGSEQQSSVR